MQRKRIRRLTAVLAVGATAVATAVCAAQLMASPDDQDALSRAIVKQKVQSGLRIARAEDFEHQDKSLSADQMLELAQSYEDEIRKSIDHAELVRVAAYRSRDIIRMTCIDDKLLQMRNIIKLAEPRFLTIRSVRHDELQLRGQFSTIQQAAERVRTLKVEIESCLGDDLDKIDIGKIGEEVPARDEDTTRPENPSTIVDRPPEASTYR
jgi:uncharacterized membrane protein YgaE (UPF0421/DUF939 family)